MEDAKVYTKGYYTGYTHHSDAPKTRKQIKEHDDKVKALLDQARLESDIAWDEMSTATVCRMTPRERK